MGVKVFSTVLLLETQEYYVRDSSKNKRIFIMSRFENLKNEEIAQELNITKKTVENHLNLALKQIRQMLTFYDE